MCVSHEHHSFSASLNILQRRQINVHSVHDKSDDIIDYVQDEEHDNVDGDNDDDYAVTARTAQTQRGSL